MSLWVDKYRPVSLEKLDYHTEQADKIKSLISTGNFPHLLIYGPPGAGKTTRIQCILRELYGQGVSKLKLVKQECVTPSNKKVDVNMVSSNFHIEINPSDMGIYDRIVVQDIIKNSSSTQQLEKSQQRDFKVIVIHEVDKLTTDAQDGLRRTMEKYMSTCRLILCAETTSKLTAAIRSRCLPLRVPAPSNEVISNVLMCVVKKEGLTMPKALAQRIAVQSNGNLRKALLMAETCKMQQYPFSENQLVDLPEWERYIKETAKMIISEQSPNRLLDVRSRLYELLIHCIPQETILKSLADELAKLCDSQMKMDLYELASDYNYRMHQGQKPIFHLEAFVARFMSVYKSAEDSLMDVDW